MYELPPHYKSRLEPAYFDDTLDDSTAWQADVYRLAANLARESEARYLVDVGCGRGHKLAQYTGEFALIGYDYGSNIQACKEKYNGAVWLAHNLNDHPIESEVFQKSVVICADVIEHLPQPEPLLESLRNAASRAAYVLLSTPDRARVYRGLLGSADHAGPPGNPHHVREWTLDELTRWLQGEGLPVRWAGWTVSNETRPDQVWTSLLILSQDRNVPTLPDRYEFNREFPNTARIQHLPAENPTGRLRVWMTPTVSEASRDTTNAIHQIVLRMGDLLPDYGVELVEFPDHADLRAAHAGQGSRDPVDVAHYHGLYNTAELHNERALYAVNSHVIRNLRTARAVTAPSEWIADVLRRDMHLSPRVIGWGVDTDEWTPVENPGLYALWNKARVDGVSDPEPMLELARRVPNMPFLTTFGQGGANVKTIGRQTYEAMKNYVRHASVYLATVTETFGIATVEAMAAGVPVLGFRHGNTAQLVEHGVTGFLAEPGDIDGLIAGLIYCMKYRDRLGANAREAAKQHTWRRVAERFAALYHELATEQPSPVKVSVVIPCHNYEQYVGDAIESALAQEAGFAYEVIVVLDRCTDSSADVVARYAERGVRSIVVDNGSLSATRNDGIQAAAGEYIVLLDADDRIGSARFLQTLAEALDADRTLGIAFTGITIMDSNGKMGHLNAWPNGYDFDKQAQRINQVPSCCMFRKEAWRRAGGFRPWFKYAEDAEFWTTVGAIGYRAQHVVREGWFHYRIHPKSASQVHRTGEIHEPDWLEFHPWTKDGQRPFAADGNPPLGSWPVRFYLKPDATVIIPVGPGHEQAVRDALHSVEGQTHRYWECVVVNDTGKPLDLMGFPWVKQAFTSNAGAGAARNMGAHFSNAPFVVFLDADDILKPSFLEKALKTYRQHGRYVYSDWMTDDRRGNTETHAMPEYSLDAFRHNPSLHAITALIPRRWFEDVGGFDEGLAAFEDVDFYMKLLVKGYCGVRLAEPLLVYNLDAGNRRKASDRQQAQFKALLKSRYGEFMENRVMCDCVDPPKGKKPVPPTPENVEEYREAYGDMIEVELISPFAPVSPTTFRGPATRVYYGSRAKGDVFHIWQADFDNSEGTFRRVEAYQADPIGTVVPPAPPATVVEFDAPPIETVTPDAPQAEMAGFEHLIHEGPPPSIDFVNDDLEGEKPLEDMTKAELRAFADEWEIDLTGHLKNRDTILARIRDVLENATDE